MAFDLAVSYLLSLGHETLAIKLGLEKTRLLLAALGNPQNLYPKVQIAGTNGKGSTAAFLDSICRAANIRSGLYTSPHLVSITERIKVNSHDIGEDDFARLTWRVRDRVADLLQTETIESPATFFEHITAVALCSFAESKVDLAILETGLGGRLDSTTAAEADLIAISPIAVDHQEYLGETISEIAAEKAAIIRRGTTAIIAPQPPEALASIIRRCEEVGVQPILLGEQMWHEIGATARGRIKTDYEIGGETFKNVTLNLRGPHQMVNAGTAINLALALREKGFQISEQAIAEGLQTAEHPGRLELIESNPPVLLDGAHNAEGARALAHYLRTFVRRPITLVFGAMRDKDLGAIGAELFPLATDIIFTEVRSPRTASAEMLAEVAGGQFPTEKIRLTRTSEDALQEARDITSADGLICVTGSLYLIGEVRAALLKAS